MTETPGRAHPSSRARGAALPLLAALTAQAAAPSAAPGDAAPGRGSSASIAVETAGSGAGPGHRHPHDSDRHRESGHDSGLDPHGHAHHSDESGHGHGSGDEGHDQDADEQGHEHHGVGSADADDGTHGHNDHAHGDTHQGSAGPAQDADDGWWHRIQHWLIERLGGEHPHGDEQDHAAQTPPLTLTRYRDGLELFVETRPLAVGVPAELAVHLTRLADFTPVTDGALRLSVTPAEPVGSDSGASRAGARPLVATAPAPSRPGLFRLRLTPTVAGEHRLVIELVSDVHPARFESASITVHADPESARAASPPETGDGVFLSKEQQWQADFATALVERRRLRGSVPATGLLRPSADGEAHLTAPIDGHLRSAPGGFPFTGMAVEAGQTIAYLVPQLGGESDVAGLELAVTRAESQLDLARQERERLDALWQDRSIAYRDVLQARSAEQVAEAELTTARRRLAQVRRTAEGEAAGVPVRAPIAGVVARVAVAPGGFVEEGDQLFHIVDRRRVWLEARVAEADIGRIREPDGAWFQVPGLAPDPTRVFEVSPQTGARLVAYGAMVDPQSRTVPVIFELPLPDDRLRVGLSVTARVLTGEVEDTLAVPAGALVNDGGADVVYVQTDGERFERRLVRAGLRDGDFVGARGGLRAGERVVTRGAYLVHLAAGAEPAQAHHHGHGH